MSKKKKNPISVSDLLKIIDKQWADPSDIAKVGCVGINRARIIKKEIKKIVEDDNYKLPSGLVPMKYVIDYFKIDINYLKKIEKINK